MGVTRAPWLTPAESAAIDSFLASVRTLLGPGLLEARLFGSRARGEGTTDSDLDLALIVTPEWRQRRHEVYDLAFDVTVQHGVQVAPLLLTRATLDELRSRELRLGLDIEREGIRL
jgi:predicted nucleotidyltransferase